MNAHASLEADQNKDNNFKCRGQFSFRLTNFKAFAEGRGPKEVTNETAEHINGLAWKIQVKHSEQNIGLFLHCEGNLADLAWTCQAVYQASVVSCSKGDDGFLQKGNGIFSAHSSSLGWEKFAKFDELMDVTNGFYDAKDDAMAFKMEVAAEEPKLMPGLRNEHALVVNGKVLFVNKYLLAAHSKFFEELFFDANAKETPEMEIKEVENAVEHFERVLSVMYPQNIELDDECVENVLLLAHRFLLGSVGNLCVKFLLEKSKMSAISKFRLAHQCGIVGMKKKILQGMSKEDFVVTAANYMDNLWNSKKLEADAVAELTERHNELFKKE
ncbi:hypothetical protein niasHS_002840 [Heterodera schachtii]|uniref:BTB domain-containing protein n=1 Tax=Heterodera schachtii TaxID=97005 RepID=A0ABD2K2L7_HETSC